MFIKVAYLLGSLNRGGTESLLLDCFRRQDEAGFTMIGIHRKYGDLLNEFRSTGVKLFHLRPKILFDPVYFFHLRNLLKKEKINIVHAQQPLDGIYAKIACIGLPAKVILTFHGYYFFGKKIGELITSFIIGRTDLNIFVSHSQMNEYKKKYAYREKRWSVVYNGIAFNKFERTGKGTLRKELGLNDQTLLLGSVGNFNWVRDQMTLCRFLVLLKKKVTDFRFLFVGAKLEKEAWRYDNCLNYCKENGLEENVFFLGSRKDVPDILGQLDAFLYSSEQDTFGIAIIEAISAGIPVFTNDLAVMSEITGNGEHAILYHSKDEHDLLEKFMQFLSDREHYISNARNNAEWVRVPYDIKTHLKALENVYRQLG